MPNDIGTPIYKLSDELKEEIKALRSEDVKEDVVPASDSSPNKIIHIQRENSLLYFACSLCGLDFQSLEEL